MSRSPNKTAQQLRERADKIASKDSNTAGYLRQAADVITSMLKPTETERRKRHTLQAKRIVRNYIYTDGPEMAFGDLNVLWHEYVMGNWSVLISAYSPGFRLYEVIFNKGDKEYSVKVYDEAEEFSFPKNEYFSELATFAFEYEEQENV